MGRSTKLNPELVQALSRFKKEAGIAKVIVFGSHITRSATVDSDVDLVLVDERFRDKKFYKRPLGLYRYWHAPWPVDFLCYTPEEFDALKKRATVVRTAAEEGVAVT